MIFNQWIKKRERTPLFLAVSTPLPFRIVIPKSLVSLNAAKNRGTNTNKLRYYFILVKDGMVEFLMMVGDDMVRKSSINPCTDNIFIAPSTPSE